MFLSKNVFNLSPLEWFVDNSDIWGNPNRYTAIDDFWYNNKQNRIYIRYDITILVAEDKEHIYVFAQFPNCPFQTEVSTVEGGKELVEQKRKQYWESLLYVLINQVFSD